MQVITRVTKMNKTYLLSRSLQFCKKGETKIMENIMRKTKILWKFRKRSGTDL